MVPHGKILNDITRLFFELVYLLLVYIIFLISLALLFRHQHGSQLLQGSEETR